MSKREREWDDTGYKRTKNVEVQEDVATDVSNLRRNESNSSTLGDFKIMNPPVFTGWSDSDPYRAPNWLRKIEKILDITSIKTDQTRVALAAFQLEGDADKWWLNASATRDVEAMTWREFRDLFLDKYFPKCVRIMTRDELHTLKQNEMSVMQYDAKLTELLHFGYDFETDERTRPSDESKTVLFEGGLRPGLGYQLCTYILQKPTYDEFVYRTLICERLEKEKLMRYETESRDSHSDSESGKRQRMTDGFANKTCYQCGELGHIRSRCPNF